ncbi:two-component sensor histidine kinase [Micromonospora sp. KC606]|uniref:sensor histidine kinase n=1 Tax=Micromonospora sp. KC606 TaxID=2530379 RepID=UPI00105177F9|nr:histidine kinase [Micromonospora sp. KC606]TDC85618.1 two-component sensor histidine kinase [Micromonospora sp. KC606]
MARDDGRTWLFWLTRLVMLLVGAALIRHDVEQPLTLTPASVLLAAAATLVWVPRHQHHARRLTTSALLLFAGSLAVTALSLLPGLRGLDGYWGGAEELGLLLSLLVVTRRGAGRLTLVAVVAGVAAIAAQPLRIVPKLELPDPFHHSVDYGVIAAAVVGVGSYLRSLDTERKRRLSDVLLHQRAEFARDLHDFIAHHVTGIVVQAQGARLIVQQDPERAVQALTHIEQAGAETMTAMRRMVGVLRSYDDGHRPDTASQDDNQVTPITPLARTADLAPLLERFTASGGPPVRLHLDGTLDGLPADADSSAYRIILEALTNVRRHAPDASAVDVSLHRTPDWLLVQVTDDAPTATSRRPGRKPGGFGLIGLTERARALGGRLHAGPGTTGGWTVEAALPLHTRPGT